ncbi:MAG: DUF1570 domain-containing protein [Kiritimatiellae bacterium]|nr:DUF1570 domain-containing protein [Kiritimatiellia bacterium]
MKGEIRKILKIFPIVIIALCFPAGVFCAPILSSQAELVGGGEIKAKILSGARGIPSTTIQAHTYERRVGDKTDEIKFYKIEDVWRERALVGTWKDKKSNRLTIARVLSLMPTGIESIPGIPGDIADKDEILKALDKAQEDFPKDEANLERWKKEWNPSAKAQGRFALLKSGKAYYVEIEFAEKVTKQEAEKLLKSAVNSISEAKRGAQQNTSMKWWESENKDYLFMTNLDRSKGKKFIDVAMTQMEAMRRAYESIVKPQGEISKCKVRVFKSLAEYREYRTSSGENDEMSCGVWDPSREELLICADDPSAAQQTMRHEAFHQYLFYATRRGDHAMWFNEGHACLFENVDFNNAKKTVKIALRGNRYEWVAKNPERVAAEMQHLVYYTREQYYSGDINLHYITGWALCAFLQFAPDVNPDFGDYRNVVPVYLKAMRTGMSADEATKRAFATVSSRNLQEDFLLFWRKYKSQIKSKWM